MGIKDILNKIEYTGKFKYEEDKNAIFIHLTITKEELNFIERNYNLNDFAKKYNIDFISLICNGEICFEHYSNVNNKENIKEKGLIIQKNDFISDLSNGIYVIQSSDFIGKDNLNNYFKNCKLEDKEILKVTGIYNGPYKICIYGLNHENYIVIPKNIKPKDISTEICFLEDEFDLIFF